MTAPDQSGTGQRFGAPHARRYEQRIRTVVPAYEVLHALTEAALAQRLGRDAHVLVVGSGTGEEIIQLGRAHPEWSFTGIDPAAAMMAICRKRLDDHGMSDRVELRQGEITDLPDDAHFAAATCLLVMHFLPDDGTKAVLLRGIAQRLAPAAPLVLADMHGDPTTAGFAALLDIWGQWQRAGGVAAEEVADRVDTTISTLQFVDEQRTEDLMAGAAFVDVQPFWRALLFGAWTAMRSLD